MTYRLAHPLALLLLLLPLIYVILEWRGSHVNTLLRYSDTRLMGGLPINWQVRLRRLPDVLRALAWLVLILALARPQVGNAQEIIRGQGVDIVLALDISDSMGLEDFGPTNRLEAAKSVIAEFVKAREYDRIGLVVFANEAFHHVPPTLDHDVLIQLLDQVQLASVLGITQGGTAIGLGIASAANMLRDSTAPSRVIILLTDGAHNADGITPIDAALDVAALGIRVYTIGIGSINTDSLITAGDRQFVGDSLDEGTLRQIADIANGRYFRASDLTDLRDVYDQINRLERSDIERQVYVQWQDSPAALLLPLSLLLLVLERLLRHTIFQTLL